MEHNGLVLVADDCEENRFVLREILSIMGIQHLEAKNGLEVLDICEHETPDLILLDIMMPQMSGEEVLVKLKANEAKKHIPVIMITAVDDTETAVRCIQNGADDYVTKPFSPVLLRARMQAALDRKRLRDMEKEYGKTLEKNLALKTTLMHVASHDLKNPLGVLMGYLDLLIVNYGKNENRDMEWLHKARGAGKLMNEMIGKFLSYQKITSDKLFLDKQEFMPGSLIRKVYMIYEEVAFAKQIKLKTALEPGLPPVSGDLCCITEALGNYVGNAIKYCEKKSVVGISCQQDGDFLRFEVRDDGPGVPVKERDALFEEFSNLSNCPTGNEKSSGLGLYIVKELITAHDGKVGADFPSDGGSCFWFEIPTTHHVECSTGTLKEEKEFS